MKSSLELTSYLPGQSTPRLIDSAMNKLQALQVGVKRSLELTAYLVGRSAPSLIDSSMNK